MRDEAEAAIRDIAEGFCPLCREKLVRHRDRACCRCCGTTYSILEHRLLMATCDEHALKECEHWIPLRSNPDR